MTEWKHAGRLGDSDPATTMGSQPTSQPSQPSHLQPGGRQQQQHSQLPHPHQNHHKANGHAAGAQTEQQPSLQKPMAGGLLGSQPSAHLLLEHPELLAHTPYVQGEDGEVPYPQTAEQTLAVSPFPTILPNRAVTWIIVTSRCTLPEGGRGGVCKH